jgi:hypothetical protein
LREDRDVRFCDRHWTRLREEVEAQEGLSDLIAPDGETAALQLAAAVESGEETAATFDPLMWSHWAIVARISEHAPEVIFYDGCPLCWVQDTHEAACNEPNCQVTRESFEEWIPGVAAAAKERWELLRT